MMKSYKLVPAITGLILVLAALAAFGLAGRLTGGSVQAVPNTIVTDPASAVVPPGGSVVVAIMADSPNPLGLGSWDVNILYDDTVFTATSCTAHPAGGCSTVLAPGEVRALGFVGLPLTGMQTLGTITFQAIGSEGESSPVVITVNDFNDGLGDPTNPGTTFGLIAIQSATPTPTGTLAPPTDTPVPPTNTPVPPTDTPVPSTDTPAPSTDTPVPPTDTPVPPTGTPVPPTGTPVPPTGTPVPSTGTPVPPTDTPVPPTGTPVPSTDTPVPSTDTPVPPPTDTPVPPTDTPVPVATEAPAAAPPASFPNSGTGGFVQQQTSWLLTGALTAVGGLMLAAAVWAKRRTRL